MRLLGMCLQPSLGGEMADDVRSRIDRPPNPLKNASLVSKLFFLWPYSLMKIGMTRPIEEADLPEVLPVDSSANNLLLMQKIWKDEMERSSKKQSCGGKSGRVEPSLHRALLVYFYKTLWFSQLKLAISMAARITQAVALGSLIETFNQEGVDGARKGYMWAGILVSCATIVLFTTHSLFFDTWVMGMRLRIACVASIYAKSLRLSSIGSINSVSSGTVMNIASNDVERFILASVFGPFMLWGPIEAIGVLFVGLQIIGPAFAAGYALLFLFIPAQFYLSSRFGTLRSKIASITDARVTLVSQAVSGARMMKMSGWENQFSERIAEIRKKEIRSIQGANRLKAWNETIFFISNALVGIIIFSVHVSIGGVLTSKNVFSTLTLINIVQMTMTKFFSLGVMTFSECYVSISRIQKFLALDEVGNELVEKPFLTPDEGGSTREPSSCHRSEQGDCPTTTFLPAVSLSHVTCRWNFLERSEVSETRDDGTNNDSSEGGPEGEIENASHLALHDVSIDILAGELCCIIGPVGCGKSALLQAIAGELPPHEGQINRKSRNMAYAAQDPWIMDGSVRENILMGLPYRAEWYDEIVASCGLLVDFTQFRNGDATIVGDRGVQCSGGQRARIGLARALYRDADVLLLDDPLSAVDSKVGRLIYFSAIMDLGVKKGKSVVLATHQHQFIGTTKCILMEKGRIVCVGSYPECIKASNGTLTEALQTKQHGGNGGVNDEKDNEGIKLDSESKVEDRKEPTTRKTEDDEEQKEINDTGEVKLRTWIEYATAMGGVRMGLLLLLLFALSQASMLFTIVEIGKWAELPPEVQKSSKSIGFIVGIGGLMILLAVMRAFLSFFLCIKASQKLHDKMTWSVLRAKIDFFDTNPLGRILNRFSADIGINDDLLPPTLYDFLVCAFIVLGGLATAVTVLPFILLVIPPLIIFFVRVRRTFVTTSRELKRLEGLTRSPIFAMLSESLSGIATIRVNNATDFFHHKFQRAHDAHTRAFFSFVGTSRWLGFRMDSIMFILMSLASFLSVLFKTQEWFNVDPAVLGLALTMLLQLGGTFQWGVRQSAEVVNQMVSVERVSAFGHLISEAPLTTEKDNQNKDWPNEGSIEVKNLKVRYRSVLPPSLTGVSFSIQSGHRVGVVGRTGSGKSTLVQALFRILDAEEGSIIVDGVDISTLGLHKLRTEMSVIPQTPVLFSGCTLRENLDPFGKHTIDNIQNALADVQMMEVVNQLPDGMDSVVSEGGSNFSVGQRQLICLARAILRKSQVLVLDEPTANVDSKTDELLQDAIAKSFEGATIIAVAHRLDTIIDFDRILVLGNGKVLEYDSPKELLSKESHFASMVKDTGESMEETLRRRAFASN